MTALPVLRGSGDLVLALEHANRLRLLEALDRHDSRRPGLAPAMRDQLRERSARWAKRATAYESAARRYRGY